MGFLKNHLTQVGPNGTHVLIVDPFNPNRGKTDMTLQELAIRGDQNVDAFYDRLGFRPTLLEARSRGLSVTRERSG